jgi:hypothetical protein
MALRIDERRRFGLVTVMLLLAAWYLIPTLLAWLASAVSGSATVASAVRIVGLISLPILFVWYQRRGRQREEESGVVRLSPALSSTIMSHWGTMIEELSASVQTFYTDIEEAIQRRSVPDLQVSRAVSREGGPLSANREYLQVRRNEYVFHICGAPFANGFFVSYWLGEYQGFWRSLIASFPMADLLFAGLLRPLTYYRIDTANMFLSLVHTAVLEVVDGMIEAKGVRKLSEADRKPIKTELLG